MADEQGQKRRYAIRWQTGGSGIDYLYATNIADAMFQFSEKWPRYEILSISERSDDRTGASGSDDRTDTSGSTPDA